jgi:hypothetical protein
MFLFKLVLALAIVVAVLILVFRFHRQIRSGIVGATAGSDKKEEGARSAELEEFIAAYRRDKASGQVQPNGAPAQPAAVPVASTAAAVKARAAFLSGPAKLAFLVLKTGLPDHHVFANTRVSDLVEGTTLPALANLPIDLLVCSKDLAIVAAVDLNSGTQSDALLAREKEQRLRGAGIRYLRFAPGAFPKPAEVRGLIYGDQRDKA